jgi:microcystin-dependent protein
MINFPTSLDTLTNPTASNPQNSPSHSGQHSDANDAIEALEAKVGSNGSAVTTSHDYKLSGVTSTAKALSDANLDTDGTLTANSDSRFSSQKAVKTYVDNHGSPTGSILPFAGSSAPTGFLIADGSSLLRADYAALFAVIGTTYGSADGTHFTLPNLKGRVVVGLDSSDADFDTLGETIGAKTHTLTEAEMPTHKHKYGQGIGVAGGGIGAVNPDASQGSWNKYTEDKGGGQAHNNIQPSLVMNYIIKH